MQAQPASAGRVDLELDVVPTPSADEVVSRQELLGVRNADRGIDRGERPAHVRGVRERSADARGVGVIERDLDAVADLVRNRFPEVVRLGDDRGLIRATTIEVGRLLHGAQAGVGQVVVERPDLARTFTERDDVAGEHEHGAEVREGGGNEIVDLPVVPVTEPRAGQ